MKALLIRVTVVLTLAALVSCSAKDPLKGPIPECHELVSDQRKDYVELAKNRCAQAVSMEEKFKEPGCAIKDRAFNCRIIESMTH